MDRDAAGLLERGLAALGIDADADTRARMLAHVALMMRWNRTYNLTAITDPADAVVLHLLDSASIVPLLRGDRVLDVGSGAGFPGLPLALLEPGRSFTLLDGRGKKTRFIEAARRATGAANVNVVQARVEQYRPYGKFDTLVARAVASLSDLYRDCRHLLGEGARLVTMKGERPVDEIRALEDRYPIVCRVESLAVPFLDAARHACILEPSEQDHT